MEKSRSLSFLLVILSLLILLLPTRASAQYVEANLDANTSLLSPAHVDANLVDGWGISFFPTSPFWIADQNTSVSTLYSANGTVVPLVVDIPCVASGAPTAPCPKVGVCAFPVPCLSMPPIFFGPTGTVANAFASLGAFPVTESGATEPALFLFSTLDGLIVGWNPHVKAAQGVVGADRSSSNAIYFGLALAGPATAPHLYAANGAASGMIDVFDAGFKLVNSFAADPAPGPFTPYGIQAIGNTLYVTYAAAAPVTGGILDVCDLGTSTTNPRCHRVFYSPPTSRKPILNAPWGIALAPANFGPLSNKILVGNVNDGRINAFVPESGGFVGTLKINGQPFSVPGLWGLAFGTGAGGSNGASNQLFFAAGPGSTPAHIFSEGVFGVITPAADPPVNW